MTRRGRFHRLAEREFAEAAEYFERESPGLGAAFITEVERCVAGILEYPESGLVLMRAVRRRLVRRFPYSVLYSVQPDHIRVLAIMHAKRRPMYWVGRECVRPGTAPGARRRSLTLRAGGAAVLHAEPSSAAAHRER